MNADTMRTTLRSHPDFKNQKTRVEDFLEQDSYIVAQVPL